jgi:hypothetical protein
VRFASAERLVLALGALAASSAAACVNTAPPAYPCFAGPVATPVAVSSSTTPGTTADVGNETPSAPQPVLVPAAPGPRESELSKAVVPPTRTERYFMWTATVDVISIPFLIPSILPSRPVYFAAPYLLATPLIHLVYGEPVKAVASVGMRLACTAGALGLARWYFNKPSNEVVSNGIGTAMVIGASAGLMLGIPILVDSFLAEHEARIEGWEKLPIVPNVSMSQGATGRTWTFGVSGVL